MRIRLTILLLVLSHYIAGAQQLATYQAKDLLKIMPEDVIPILSHNNVLDMIDFLDASCKAEVTNRMNGKSEMTELTGSSASIRITSSNVVDIHVLPKGSNNVLIYVISTVTTDSLADSSIKVYKSNWQPAEKSLQFQFEHPENYNYVQIDSQKGNITLREVHRQLLFEGETTDDKPDIIKERHGSWDSSKGLFIISQNSDS